MRVVITGAAGRIGGQLIEELADDHQLCVIDRRSVVGLKSCTLDLGQRRPEHGVRNWLSRKNKSWRDLLVGCDAIVHLAANADARAPWKEIVSDNVQGTWNIIEAAAEYRVPRVVFASSNWAVKAMENRSAPECYLPEGPKISSAASPCPINPYGISKAIGEIAGRMFVDEGRLTSFIAVRIGNYNPRPPRDELLRTRWIGAEDIRRLFRRCVEAKLKGFHVVYGVSAQSSAPYDLSYTRQILSWEPQQSSANV